MSGRRGFSSGGLPDLNGFATTGIAEDEAMQSQTTGTCFSPSSLEAFKGGSLPEKKQMRRAATIAGTETRHRDAGTPASVE